MPPFEESEVVSIVLEDITLSFADPRTDRGITLPPVDTIDESNVLVDEFGVMGNDLAASVAWRYRGRHTERFLGLEPTGRIVEVEGITIVTPSDDGPQLTRLIDWHSVYLQLGAARGGHPVTELGDVEWPDPDQLPNGLTAAEMQELFPADDS